jgi:protoheme IX farnesyltransferase
LLISTLGGIALIIASACVFNNYIDRGIDTKMARTKKRALVSGLISTKSALVYATVLGLLGFLILAVYTNILTVYLGLLAMFTYIVLYGISKRTTVHGTVVGSIAGALPPVAGYTAVANRLDSAALILFLILVFWQMPHFYAIAIYRLKDYRAAGIPVLPAEKGNHITKIQMLIYILAFSLATVALTLLGYTGIIFLIVMLTLGLLWFIKGWLGFNATDDSQWARGMFLFSLIVICGLSVMLAIGPILP